MMIIDELKNWQRYETMSVNLAATLKHAFESNLLAHTQGRHELPGEVGFINRMSLTTRCSNEVSAENHRDFLDIHCPLNAAECLEVVQQDGQVPSKTYDVADDYELYDLTGEPVAVRPGQFLVLFPGEIHKTAIAEHSYALEKAVIKLPVDAL